MRDTAGSSSVVFIIYYSYRISNKPIYNILLYLNLFFELFSIKPTREQNRGSINEFCIVYFHQLM